MPYIPHAVTIKTPPEAGFLGGGISVPAFHEIEDVLVVSIAIQLLINVTVKQHSPVFGERCCISYAEIERVNEVAEIQKEIVYGIIELIGSQEPLSRGFHSFKFQTYGRVGVDAITLDRETSKLLNALVMLWTGVPRKAELIPYALHLS